MARTGGGVNVEKGAVGIIGNTLEKGSSISNNKISLTKKDVPNWIAYTGLIVSVLEFIWIITR